MTPKDVTSATKAFIQAWRKDVVPDEVISQRSRICKSCPVREKSFVAGLLKSIIDKNGVPKELSDHRCGICKCPLLNLVVAKEPHVDNEKERRRRLKGNPNCWLLKL